MMMHWPIHALYPIGGNPGLLSQQIIGGRVLATHNQE